MQKCNPSRTSACVYNWPKYQIKGAASASKQPLELLCHSVLGNEMTHWFNFHFKLTQISISHLLPEFGGGLQATFWTCSPSPAHRYSHAWACSAAGGAGRQGPTHPRDKNPLPQPCSRGGYNERHQKSGAVGLALQRSSQVLGWQEEGCVRGSWSLGRLQDRVEQLSIITSLRHGNENSILPSCSRYQQGQLSNACSKQPVVSLPPILPTLKPCWAAEKQIRKRTNSLKQKEKVKFAAVEALAAGSHALAGSGHWWLLPGPLGSDATRRQRDSHTALKAHLGKRQGLLSLLQVLLLPAWRL